MKLNVPGYAKKVIERLEKSGFEAYIVGGCVRDCILSKTPDDFDITTSATPDVLLELFSGQGFSAIPTGIAHGTVTVLSEKTPVEVTTFRIDGKYSDFRRPEAVAFTPSLAEDLKRRDFTVNAMSYSESRGLIDLHGGLEDLENGIIRAVGEPEVRFSEDALRIIRGLRFCAVLGFTMDKKTEEAARRLTPLLEKISKERICTELSKLLCGKACQRILRDCGDMIFTIMGLDTEAHRDIFGIFSALGQLSASLPVRLAVLYRDLPPRAVREILHTLRFDTKTADRTAAIISACDGEASDYKSVKRLCRRAGADVARDVLVLKIALGCAHGQVLEFYDEIIASGDCLTLRELAVNGEDLRSLGFMGAEIGEALEYLLDRVVEGELENEKKRLLEAALKYRK